jgi:very-short-patch-repair endonuclease
MPRQQIVVGQHVDPIKQQRAKELRGEMTPHEAKLWNCLRANRLNGLRFRRQQVIDGFIVDFYCHSASVVIEVDGPIHNEQTEYDTARDQVLAAGGLRILRFTNAAIDQDVRPILAAIATACAIAP